MVEKSSVIIPITALLQYEVERYKMFKGTEHLKSICQRPVFSLGVSQHAFSYLIKCFRPEVFYYLSEK